MGFTGCILRQTGEQRTARLRAAPQSAKKSTPRGGSRVLLVHWRRGNTWPLLRIGDGPDEVHYRQIFKMEAPPPWSVADSPYVMPGPA